MLDFERETATLGRKEAKELSAHSLEALTETFKEMGLTVEMGRSTYYAEGHKIDFKFSVEIPAKADVMKNSELSLYGIDAKVGDEFSDYGGTKYRILGVNAKARKYPIRILKLDDNTERKAPASFVKRFQKNIGIGE
jgi:hypothetical protein|tara:strand:- start:55 stop:465 length:411 start_codon:yes stop_codon:yes gene_type:complete